MQYFIWKGGHKNEQKYLKLPEVLEELRSKLEKSEYSMYEEAILKSFLSDVFIYEEEQKDGRILKRSRFKFRYI